MQMLMNGWTHSERKVRWNEVFHHVVVLWLYLLLISNAMVKEGVPCVGIMLIMRQYVRFIYFLRKDLWLYNLKKRDLYSHSQIQSSIMLWKKLGLITAELFSHGFLFTVHSVEESQRLAETKEASTAGEQLKNRQSPFFPPASEAVVNDS
ncbi:MAG: hypothetical protein ACQEUD_02025 [Bacillota bacterium]